ncbi:MAG: 2-oxo acid dehydrogenase subunit E2 [Deltaproteobacteria bacterium]|nr:2-oxo acid dehydrogenase subunit E2 [Deltaproteobacteria bacterium]
MVRDFKLPDLGEGIHEGDILSVLVKVGDKIEEGQPILEIETDKATVEIPSPYTGTVENIAVNPGDVVQVGGVLMSFSVEGEGAAPREEAEKPAAVKEEAERKPPKKEEEKKAEAAPGKEGPVPASPSTRRLARELGVDLHQVSPSGPGGRVTAEDVKAFAEKPETAARAGEEAPTPTSPPSEKAAPPRPADWNKWGPIERIQLRSVRRATARQMALAWSKIPHVGSQEIVDITKLEAFRKRHKVEIEAQGGRLTLTVLALKATVAALKKFPRFNASLDEETQEIVLKKYYHIGVAVDTKDGLLVPVVRDVDRKSIAELSIELHEIGQRTRDRKVSLEELQGGSFTITNIGPLGGTAFAPIINYPEVAILGLARARWQPEIIGDVESGQYTVEPRLMLPVMMSFDHRVLDGADAERFLLEVVGALEDPDRFLMVI